MSRCRLLVILTFALLLLPVLRVSAESVHWNGYASQAFVSSQDNPYFQEDAGDSFDFREIGINFSWQASARLRFSAQAISRKIGDLENGSPKLDYALVDYQFWVQGGTTFGVRAGRVKNKYGFYNNTRDVPHARPGVFAPPSVYFETFRDPLLSVDGINLYFSGSNHLGDLSINGFWGKTDLKSEVVEVQVYAEDIQGSFEEADIVGFNVSFVPAGWHELNLGYSFLGASMELENTQTFTPEEQFLAAMDLANNPQNAIRYVTSTKISPDLHLLSLQYSKNQWVFTGEYLLTQIDFSDFEVLHQPADSEEFELQGYYLQAEWLAHSKLSTYARFEDLIYNVDDRRGEDFAQLTGGNPVTQYTQSYTLGARWYFTPDLSLTGEFSRNKGTAFINGPRDIDYQSLVEDWDLFVLQLSYHF